MHRYAGVGPLYPCLRNTRLRLGLPGLTQYGTRGPVGQLAVLHPFWEKATSVERWEVSEVEPAVERLSLRSFAHDLHVRTCPFGFDDFGDAGHCGGDYATG